MAPTPRHSRTRRLSAILALCATAAVALATAASAGQAFQETIHHEGAFPGTDFCGAGLEVEIAFVLDLRVHVVPHGPDRLDYFLQHGDRTEVITNPANDRFVTTAVNVTEKDMRVTDNGDGTLTVLVLATGNAVVYGADGKALARDPGQVRFELLFAHNGTLTDPSDDTFLGFLGLVKGSTGRSDDFCGAVVPALS